MSDPQNQNIRGPAYTTLGALAAQLGAIADGLAALPTLAADVAQIKGDLRRLVGTTAPGYWDGLPNYFNTVLQNPNTNDLPIGFHVENIFVRIISVLEWLAGFNQGAIAPGNNDGIWQRIGEVRSALTVDSGNTPLARLTAISAAVNALSLVVGTLEESPTSETIKFILSEIRTCCEDGGTTDPPTGPPTNPAPSLCLEADGWSAPIRCTALVNLGVVGTQTLYGVEFGGQPTPAGLALVSDVNPNWVWNGIKRGTTDAVSVCFSWNLTGITFTGTMSVRSSDFGDWGSSDLNANISPLGLPTGNKTTNIASTEAIGLQIEADNPPAALGNNFFLQWKYTAS